MFAAYVAGTATMVGMDFGAKFLASLAVAFEVMSVTTLFMKAVPFRLRNGALMVNDPTGTIRKG